jgi:hypothetical protein
LAAGGQLRKRKFAPFCTVSNTQRTEFSRLARDLRRTKRVSFARDLQGPPGNRAKHMSANVLCSKKFRLEPARQKQGIARQNSRRFAHRNAQDRFT